MNNADSLYKGIILAGGSGTRLHPLTLGVSKQLLPVYDKPMIYYPLSVLMLADIKEILIITTPNDIDSYKRLLGDGSDIGISIDYAIQENPNGIAEAFIIGEKFIDNSNVALILGDNIFYGKNLQCKLNKAVTQTKGCTIFGYKVENPESFGVIEFANEKVISIEEKPINPKSNYAVTGLYFYDNEVIDIAKSLSPSNRGEIEITDINNSYLNKELLNVMLLESNFKWLDSGTHTSLIEAGKFIQDIEYQTNCKIACLEEIAFKNGWITKNMLLKKVEMMLNTDYGKYLKNISKN